jgi:ABC-2 type transport system ATP-binding protein
MNDSDTTVIAEGLRKTFEAPGGGPLLAVNDVSMTIRAGELTALVGPGRRRQDNLAAHDGRAA